MVYTVGNITYFHLLKEFILLFFLLLGIYFVPVLCALLYIIPANDKMLSPISALSRQVQAFSLGTEPPEIWESDDEIGELSSSFYRMAVNINQQSMEISKKSGKGRDLLQTVDYANGSAFYLQYNEYH